MTVAIVLAAGIYNDAVAPPAPTAFTAHRSALTGGSVAAPGADIAIEGSVVAIGSHHLLDATAGRFIPLDGGASFSANATAVTAPTAGGDAFVWVEPGSPTTIQLRDLGLGTSASVAIPAGLEPRDAPLVVSDRVVSWSYHEGGESRVAGFLRSMLVPSPWPIPLAGNVTAVAALGADVLVTNGTTGERLWSFNVSDQRLLKLAEGDGVAEVSAGATFAAWVNRSVPQAEYFDRLSRAVDSIPVPNGVRAQWVRASPNAVLVGGLLGGLFGDSPRAFHYDFPTGNAAVYVDLGVEIDGAIQFGLAGDTLVAIASRPLPRAPAPLTPAILGVAVVAMVVTVYLGTRDAFQGEE